MRHSALHVYQVRSLLCPVLLPSEASTAGTPSVLQLRHLFTRTHDLRLDGVPPWAGSAWDDRESLLYVLWRMHVGSSSAMFPDTQNSESASASHHSHSSDGNDERALARAKEGWLCQTTGMLPAPLDALRLRVGQRLLQGRREDRDSLRQIDEPPVFSELMALAS